EQLISKFKVYCFEPLETPAMERLEVLSSKFAGGEEILKETFKVSDQGGRELGLRYDLTVPLCRFIASNTRMPFPFKRYAVAPVWRDGPLKAGRYREFYQCDVDIVGANGMIADAEILRLACDAFDILFPRNYVIKVNNRKILDGILCYSGVPEGKWQGAILIIDKLPKIGRDGVARALGAFGITKESSEKILGTIYNEGPNTARLEKIAKLLDSKIAMEGISEISELLKLAENFGCASKIVFDPSLARGLNYYTSTIFEAYLSKGKIASSIAAGGRYDDLIGRFAGSRERIPAVGISFGLDVICEALLETGFQAGLEKPGVYVLAVSKDRDSPESIFAIKASTEFRKAKVPAYLDLTGRNLAKGLEFASKKGFRFAAIIGEKERKLGKVNLKDLENGAEKELTLPEATALLL
ncbi:MAG: histidine--tRNA ligase, partial [Candidatus Micrarchaeota archaeon]